MSAGDLLVSSIADALADRLEKRASERGAE